MNRFKIRTALWLVSAVVLGLVLAVGTPAGTSINNQASATYEDADGNELTATSELVTTIVQQIYDLSIKPDTADPSGTDATDNAFTTAPAPANDLAQLAGGDVVFEYFVTNTGNGDDTVTLQILQDATDDFDFATLAVYLDDPTAPGAGSFDLASDTLLFSSTAATGNAETATLDLDADEQAKIFVVGTVPSAQASDDVAQIDLVGTSVGDTDAFDNNNIAAVTVIDDAVIDMEKTSSYSAGTITYTVTGTNIGAEDAELIADVIDLYSTPGSAGVPTDGILVEDILPTATLRGSPAAPAASLSFAGITNLGSLPPSTTAIYYYDPDGAAGPNPEGWYSAVPATLADVERVGLLITDPLEFSPSESFTLVFAMSTDGTELAGDIVDNTATTTYEDSDGDTQTTTASDTLTIPAATDVLIGPNDDADADGEGDATGDDLDDGGVSYTSTSGDTIYYGDSTTTYLADTQYLERAEQGSTVHFTNTIENTGNSTTTYRLSLSGSLPAGFGVSFYSGGTALVGNEVTIAPGASQDIEVRITIPAGAAIGAGLDYEAIVTVTRVNPDGTLDGSVSDTTTNIIGEIFTGAGLDLQNDEDTDADGEPDTPTDATLTYEVEVDPDPTGTDATVNVALTVTNSGTDADVYDLSEVLTGLPAGTTVEYFLDTDGDGEPDGTALGDSETGAAADGIVDTGSVAGGTSVDIIAVVTLPAGSSPLSGSIDFTATSSNDPTESDTVTDIITILGPALTFEVGYPTTSTSPDTVFFTHTIENNGNVDFTSVTLEPDDLTGLATGFTYTIYVDLNEDGDFDDAGEEVYTPGATPVVTPFALAVGEVRDVLIEVDVAAGLGFTSPPTVETKTIVAIGTTASGTTVTSSLTDIITITDARIDVDKTVVTYDGADPAPSDCTAAGIDRDGDGDSGDDANPGDYLCYSILAENLGNQVTYKVEVRDQLPLQYTDLISVSVDLSGLPRAGAADIYYGTVDPVGDCTGYASTVPTLLPGSALCIAVDTNGDDVIDSLDDLLTGESFEVSIVVQVK